MNQESFKKYVLEGLRRNKSRAVFNWDFTYLHQPKIFFRHKPYFLGKTNKKTLEQVVDILGLKTKEDCKKLNKELEV